jgi:Transglutaminase-like superfamily
MSTGSYWEGVRAALDAPEWVVSKRLGELLALPAAAAGVPHPEPDRALLAARRTLRVLAHLPGGRWRTSCLYESVAECLVLRRAGIPAAVCIGVKREADGSPGLAAHAWVARNETDTRFHGFSTLGVLEDLRAQR